MVRRVAVGHVTAVSASHREPRARRDRARAGDDDVVSTQPAGTSAPGQTTRPRSDADGGDAGAAADDVAVGVAGQRAARATVVVDRPDVLELRIEHDAADGTRSGPSARVDL